MKTITMLKTAAGPEYVLPAGDTFRMSDRMAAGLMSTQTTLDQQGSPDHGKKVKIEPAARLARGKREMARAAGIPARPDPEEKDVMPDEDQLTEDEAPETE
jgi:hypothetical protein